MFTPEQEARLRELIREEIAADRAERSRRFTEIAKRALNSGVAYSGDGRTVQQV